jgi:hypothetical protein
MKGEIFIFVQNKAFTEHVSLWIPRVPDKSSTEKWGAFCQARPGSHRAGRSDRRDESFCSYIGCSNAIIGGPGGCVVCVGSACSVGGPIGEIPDRTIGGRLTAVVWRIQHRFGIRPARRMHAESTLLRARIATHCRIGTYRDVEIPACVQENVKIVVFCLARGC